MWDNFILLIFWAYLIVYIFLNFLISLFYVSPDTRLIHRDRYASGPSESMTDTATLNHDLWWLMIHLDGGMQSQED